MEGMVERWENKPSIETARSDQASSYLIAAGDLSGKARLAG